MKAFPQRDIFHNCMKNVPWHAKNLHVGQKWTYKVQVKYN